MAGVWRQLERQRGEEQLGLAEIAGRKAALEEEITALEAEVAGLNEMRAYIHREADRVSAEADAVEERVSERRRQLDSSEGLRDVLEAAGEEAVEAACIALGWIEADA
jgi:hypothetical protein